MGALLGCTPWVHSLGVLPGCTPWVHSLGARPHAIVLSASMAAYQVEEAEGAITPGRSTGEPHCPLLAPPSTPCLLHHRSHCSTCIRPACMCCGAASVGRAISSCQQLASTVAPRLQAAVALSHSHALALHSSVLASLSGGKGERGTRMGGVGGGRAGWGEEEEGMEERERALMTGIASLQGEVCTREEGVGLPTVTAGLREQQQRLGEFEAHVGGPVWGGEVLVCVRCQQPIDLLHAVFAGLSSHTPPPSHHIAAAPSAFAFTTAFQHTPSEPQCKFTARWLEVRPCGSTTASLPPTGPPLPYRQLPQQPRAVAQVNIPAASPAAAKGSYRRCTAVFASSSLSFHLQCYLVRHGCPRSTRRAANSLAAASSRRSTPIGTAAPKGLFPPEPEKYTGPKLKVAIVGAGLAGMSTAAELLDQGHESGAVDNLLRKEHTHVFINKGGVTGAVHPPPPPCAVQPVDKAFNALALATSPVVRALVDPEGAFQDIRDLDKARPAPPLPSPPSQHVSFSEWFTSHGGTRESIKRMWDPVAYALGFIDCDNISARCMLTIFAFFATKTEASVLRMLCGSPDRFLAGPIAKYITDRGGRFHVRQPCQEVLYSTAAHGSTVVTGLRMKQAGDKEQIVTADAYVAALDVPGAKRLVPGEWRERWAQFRDIYELVGVPVITVQLRYDGWVTEMNDIELSRQLARAAGLDNLLYSPDADFSCFADLALTSPDDYYKEGQGSLMQSVPRPAFTPSPPTPALPIATMRPLLVVLAMLSNSFGHCFISVVITPADPYMPMTNEAIVAKMNEQVMELFPSARGLTLLWHSVVKINQSLYREAPGLDQFRPDQKTPVPNFFLAGSYTKQVRPLSPRSPLCVPFHSWLHPLIRSLYHPHFCNPPDPLHIHLSHPPLTSPSHIPLASSSHNHLPPPSFHSSPWQDYIDSMEGATLSGRKAAARICEAGEAISTLASQQRAAAPAAAV
ncbi:unnamed protein product [Closterium sp. Naga37s-1]|nr:unnamed protein product [Closterium sp. Naga37s-1]